jgi:thymidylate synthase (methanogen type)
MNASAEGRIPTLHVVGNSIPQVYYRTIKAVWENGLGIRTEYDRKNSAGEYIDPPSRDARVLVEITDPFAQPRFPPISFCEIGTYIAEIMGVKDFRVVPFDQLQQVMGGELNAQEWPYTYHQRLFAHPDAGGSVVDQIELAINRIAETPHTRRAVATTSVPNLDPYLKEDIPCLREVQLRCPEDCQGNLILNMNTVWRSRDLYKAWGDNIIALTFLQQYIAQKIQLKSNRIVRVGSYADYSSSLHIYGQDFGAVGGDSDRGLQSFFDTFDEDSFVARSLPSDIARDMLILPQLENLLSDREINQWHFPQTSVDLIKQMIKDIESGTVSV